MKKKLSRALTLSCQKEIIWYALFPLNAIIIWFIDQYFDWISTTRIDWRHVCVWGASWGWINLSSSLAIMIVMPSFSLSSLQYEAAIGAVQPPFSFHLFFIHSIFALDQPLKGECISVWLDWHKAKRVFFLFSSHNCVCTFANEWIEKTPHQPSLSPLLPILLP